MNRLLVFLVVLIMTLPGTVGASQCLQQVDATPYEFQFDSGARWEMCWHIDPHAGLVISDVFYAAPAEHPRQLLDSASVGQILFKYDEDTTATHLLSEPGLGGRQFVSSSVDACEAGELVAGVNGAQLCQRNRDHNHLTKVRRTESIRRHEVSLHAHSSIGKHRYETVWRFSEDGGLSPSVLFTGSINRYTNDARYGVSLDGSGRYASSAVLHVNWRLDFNIDGTANNDLVDEIEFVPVEGNKRAISITPLEVEAARAINAQSFRGWRISDAEVSSGEGSGTSATTRVGYYLDPQVAGFRYFSKRHPWTSLNFFVTEKDPCEKLASSNQNVNGDCADSLDGFVDDATLQDADVVAWFSVSRQFTPQRHDYPAISTREIGFKLIPFDWSASSPFESLAVSDDNGGGD